MAHSKEIVTYFYCTALLRAVAHSTEGPFKVEYLGRFKYIFETASGHEPGDQLGTFGEIILDKKISRYCPCKSY